MTPETLIASIPYYEETGRPVTSRLAEIYRMLCSLTWQDSETLSFLSKEIDHEITRWQSGAKRREFWARHRSGVAVGLPYEP